ncbi:hypothetical protein IFM89_025183 [Coptis chinensis]|uniref:Uncharacterized protein n=1 Tax=Coptis chinensis TaxID=261450 RepID=A0A835ICT2_9MAGN|nr:hypothetical protein IFM89_025183 [Coptis chinensis]
MIDYVWYWFERWKLVDRVTCYIIELSVMITGLKNVVSSYWTFVHPPPLSPFFRYNYRRLQYEFSGVCRAAQGVEALE